MILPGRRSEVREDPSPAVLVDEGGARDETALMVRFRERRGPAEFQALYEGTRRGLLAWISGQVRVRGIPEDPVDLLQDTFVNIFRYPTAFRDERGSSFRVWSRRITTNVCRRAALRSPGRRLPGEDPGPPPEPADLRAGPGESLVSAEESSSLARAWMILLALYAESARRLQPRERTALELVEVEERTYVEAARILGVGSSNMKMIVFRARKRIRAGIARRMGAIEGGAREG